MKSICLSLIVAVSISLSCDQNKTNTPTTLPNGSVSEKLEFIKDPSNFNSESERLNFLFEVYYEFSLSSSPIFATFFGKFGYDHLWDDYSPDGVEKKNHMLSLFIETPKWFDPKSLSEEDRLNFSVYKSVINHEFQLKGNYAEHYLIINQTQSVHHVLLAILSLMSTNNVKDLENIFTRLKGIPEHLNGARLVLQEGIDNGIVVPKTTVVLVPDQIEGIIGEHVENSPFLALFSNLNENKFPGIDLDSIRNEVKLLIQNEINPAFSGFKQFLQDVYIPNTRETYGISHLPNGKNWYDELVSYHTTTELTAEQIHQIGLDEVARIENEMVGIKEGLGFSGDLPAFNRFLKTDPQFFYKTKEEILAGYQSLCKSIDPEIPKLFGNLPRVPYGVEAVPEYAEKGSPGAYYLPGSLEKGVAGHFYVNTYDLKSRPKWEMEVLTFHEAIPGHHLQVAISQELKDIPEFVSILMLRAYAEGWGLYAESLGEELGFYQDPYSKYGQLTSEIFRAIRLVVDTGIHSYGWSRQKAIDYFKEHSALGDFLIASEVDRYIAWPGQALSYKIGELKIKELRSKAEEKLKDQFDIREFHDVVLGNGTIPLSVLEIVVNEWIEEKLRVG